MSIFNPSQKITAKLFYNLVAQLDGEQRIGAIKALSTLIPVTEDGYMTINETEPRTDFFVQCFDVLIAVALSLKMLEDDGLVPKELDWLVGEIVTVAGEGTDRLNQRRFSMSLKDTIEQKKKELEDLEAEEARFAAMSADKRLAIALHSMLCRWNHTDGCG